MIQIKKTKRVLQVGDKVKFVGYLPCGHGAFYNYYDVLQNEDLNSKFEGILTSCKTCKTEWWIARRQVYKVCYKVKKKKQPRVISDERFFVNNYESSGTQNSIINNTIGDAINVSRGCKLKGILELGIVAKHSVNK